MAINAPTDISGCVLWLDANLSSFTYQSGTLVSQWNDKSGNNNHATQNTAGAYPSRSGVWGNRTTVIFDGTTDFLNLTSNITVPDAGFSAFVVMKPAGTGDRVMVGGTTAAAYEWRISGADGKQTLNRSHATDTGSSTTAVSATYHILSLTSATTLRSFYVDGTADGTNSASVGAYGAINLIGSGYDGANKVDFFQTEIAAVILYNVLLGTTDRNNVENYLRKIWFAGDRLKQDGTYKLLQDGTAFRFLEAGAGSKQSDTASTTVTVSATGTATQIAVATGATTATVSATGSATATYGASGAATATVSATGSCVVIAVGATGASTITASATGTATQIAVATAASTITASATGAPTATYGASASATATVSATGDGTQIAVATGTATAGVSATGDGTQIAVATGASTLTVSATGSGTQIAVATGASTITVSATGDATVITGGGTQQATGTSTITFSATGDGTQIAVATGASTLTASATAVGTQVAVATGASTLTVSATATGIYIASATSTATITTSGNATAIYIARPSASAMAAFSAIATPKRNYIADKLYVGSIPADSAYWGTVKVYP